MQIYTKVEEIRKTVGNLDLQIFTDGSTWKSKSYSGVGIHIKSGTRQIMDVSLPLVTYGNNFHAEVAGITIAAWAACEAKSCVIYTDSQSTIDTIEQSRTERDWVRTPIKGWLKQLQGILEGNPHIKLAFVKGHTGKKDWISLGNERADYLAKKGNCDTKGEVVTLDNGGVYISYNKKILLSGIKNDIRSIFDELRRLKCNQLRHQGMTLRSPRFKKIMKEVRDDSVTFQKHWIWSYFILASVRWLTPPPLFKSYLPCQMCKAPKNNVEHLLNCPTLKHMHTNADLCLQSLPSLPDNTFPMSTSSSTGPSQQQLLSAGYTRRMTNWVVSFNLGDKLCLLAGIFPKSLNSMLRHYCPKTFKEDERVIRMELLENLAKMYKVYLDGQKVSIGGKNYQVEKNSGGEKQDVGTKTLKSSTSRSRVNVFLEFEDRKKRHGIE